MAKTGHQMLDIDYSERGLIHMMLQSAGQWYFNEDGSLDILDNAALKASLEQYARIWQSGIVKPVSGWANFTGGFTSGEIASVPVGVWITGTIKANADQSGKWAVAPIPKLAGVPNAVHASNWGGSSWYVLAKSPNKAAAIDFLKSVGGSDVAFYQKILVDQGAVGTLLAARTGDAYRSRIRSSGSAGLAGFLRLARPDSVDPLWHLHCRGRRRRCGPTTDDCEGWLGG